MYIHKYIVVQLGLLFKIFLCFFLSGLIFIVQGDLLSSFVAAISQTDKVVGRALVSRNTPAVEGY